MWPSESAIASFLDRVSEGCRRDRVMVTQKAADEAEEEPGWFREDMIAQLLELEVHDFEKLVESTERPGDLIWVFCPEVEYEGQLWIRLTERQGIVVFSFHRA